MSSQAKHLVIILLIEIVKCEGMICYLSSCSFHGGMKWTLPKKEAPNCTQILPGGHSLSCPDEDTVLSFKTPFVLSNSKDQGRLNTALVNPVRCPKNMEYGNCSCQATCEDPRNENGCSNSCSVGETCVCSSGFLKEGDNCVRQQDCGCFLEGVGVIKEGGLFINSNCSTRCSCQDNQLMCDNLECSADATCREIEGAHQCNCDDGFVEDGQLCVAAATDCLDLFNAGVKTDGVYTIYPTGWAKSGFEVFCEMESNGGGWTVFQRRVNGIVNFYRNWTSYKHGFGTLKHEFWLGNDKIHILTHQQNQQLRIDVKAPNGTPAYSLHDSFHLNNETDKYRLIVGTKSGNTVGNPLRWNNKQPFSTYDQDNDDTTIYNCAMKHQGAWWYNYHNDSTEMCWKWLEDTVYEFCTDSNLNGVYNGDGVESMYFWYNDIPQSGCRIIQTEMKLRRDGGIYINSDRSRRCSCSSNQLLACEDLVCGANATCRKTEGSYQCQCNQGFVGDGRNCTVAAIDCLELYNAGVTTNGVYRINPTGWIGSGFEVYCEMESNGGGWTVFQRRLDGSMDFFRNWTSYKDGFGILSHEFWLGNEKTHTLTQQNNYQLRIDLLNSQGGSVYHLYDSFSISEENDKYRLSAVHQSAKTAGVVGNPLRWNNGQPFSTYDEDNDDTNTYNCAQEHRGVWWYKYVTHDLNYNFCWKWQVGNTSRFCSDSNLNGDYQENGVSSIFFWYDQNYQSGCGITRTEMKIRPL